MRDFQYGCYLVTSCRGEPARAYHCLLTEIDGEPPDPKIRSSMTDRNSSFAATVRANFQRSLSSQRNGTSTGDAS